jgi:hypothetical protein
MADIRVNLNESSIDAFLNDPAGPVGDLLETMADKGSAIARGLAPVREGDLWNNSATRSSNARPPGYTKASIHGKRGVSRQGNLYGSVNAAADPTIFLEYPAQQMHEKRPFLTTALWSITVM